jgi:Mn-dependent DtxR family transcriptional regulator
MPDSCRQRAVNFIIKSRADRQKFFRSSLFSDPAWDMLLRLYSAAIEEQVVSAESLAEAANVHSSTAVRWIMALERAGLIEKREGGVIALSKDGWFSMESYFEGLSSATS